MRRFAMEVLTLVDDVFVLFCEFVYKFLSSIASFLAFCAKSALPPEGRYLSLFSLQFQLGTAQVARVRNLFAVGSREEGFKPNVNANDGSNFNLGNIRDLYRNIGIPARCFSLNRKGFTDPSGKGRW